MQNFGKIKNAIYSIMIDSIIEKNAEKRIIAKRFIKGISENKILKTQFLVYNNIERRIDENQFSANVFVTDNLNLLKKYSKEQIEEANKALVGKSQMVNNRLNIEYDKKGLHEAITALLFTDMNPTKVQSLTESRMTVVTYINENEEKAKLVKPETPTALIANVVVDKFNKKYADLNESEHRVLNVIIDTNNDDARKEVFTETSRGCIDLIDSKLKTTTNKEKLLEAKDRLLRSEYDSETFVENITKMLDLNRTLRN